MFYTSNMSGNYNIWTIPETGGEAIQVTSGAGPDYGISVSTTANRMVFSQRTYLATLWMVNTDGTGHRQVYPDENIMDSHIAPDGNTIVLEISHPSLRPTLMLREILGGRQEILTVSLNVRPMRWTGMKMVLKRQFFRRLPNF